MTTSTASAAKPAVSKAAPATVTLPQNMPPDELRRKIDSQITRLRSLLQPSPKDLQMLQKLQEFSEQIPAASCCSAARPEEEGDSQGSSFTEVGVPGGPLSMWRLLQRPFALQTGSPAARNASPNAAQPAGGSRTLLPRPKSSQFMREINNLLAETRDLMEKPPLHEETLLVEFRILGQRFQIRLSRSQKSELESVSAGERRALGVCLLESVQLAGLSGV